MLMADQFQNWHHVLLEQISEVFIYFSSSLRINQRLLGPFRVVIEKEVVQYHSTESTERQRERDE